MSEQNAPASKPVTRLTGMKAALQYTGVPPSWLDKRPKLPSRNWLIFLGVTSGLIGSYVYDRRQCKRIRQDYVDRVKHLAEEPLDPGQFPRKVTVYGAKWPGDEDYDQSLKYFRKYVKPILVAAAVDYDMVKVKRQGELTRLITDEIKTKRRIDAGLEKPPAYLDLLPIKRSPEELRKHELDGGIIIVGRPTFKEFMEGLRRGWTESMVKVDKDEMLSQQLEQDGHFDEPPEVEDSSDSIETVPSRQNTTVYSPYNLVTTHSSASAPTLQLPSDDTPPPASIPPLPPITFVPFTDHIGFTQIPLMIWGFFNERHKVRSGAESAYRLIMKSTRPVLPPSLGESSVESTDASSSPTRQGGDLDFDMDTESFFKRSLATTNEDLDKIREKYYKELPAKLATARALARGTREATKEEINYPPPTEVELRAERMKKEKRWRDDLEGWEIVKPQTRVAWDDRFADALSVFVDPPVSTTTTSDDSTSPST